ncbi:MAG: hypothetical protein U0165_17915 [Polyangiaceae bacterium]
MQTDLAQETVELPPRKQPLLDVVWDMETGDPDDFLTLLLLLGHPDVRLKAVTITPGTTEQVGLVRRAVVEWFQRDIPIGAFNIEHTKSCVSGWHQHAFGPIVPSKDAALVTRCYERLLDDSTTLLTGAPLKNLGRAIRQAEADGRILSIGRWVAQGGFAGDSIVPESDRLPQFAGRETCPTYNFNGDPKSALLALSYDGVRARKLVSKNVCHGVFYDQEIHALVR